MTRELTGEVGPIAPKELVASITAQSHRDPLPSALTEVPEWDGAAVGDARV